MNEVIKVRLQRNAVTLKIRRRVPGGVELDEPDPMARAVGIGLSPRNPLTADRMASVGRTQGWEPRVFKLNVSVEGGALVLRGVTKHALPEGAYDLRLQLDEAKTLRSPVTVVLPHDGQADVQVPIALDDRDVAVDLSGCDPGIETVLTRSQIDGESGTAWLTNPSPRPTRQACLLNLLASLRVRPTVAGPLLPLVRDVFYVGPERAYARVDLQLAGRIMDLVLDPKKPFYAEGTPHAAVHGRLLVAIPEPPEVRQGFNELRSFRSEGRPSMQIVIATPPPGLPYTYAEFDLDLSNPLQDVVGFFVHMGELLDGKPTNHLDLRKKLAKTKAGDFLYYRVV
jgi:hypothetical protein